MFGEVLEFKPIALCETIGFKLGVVRLAQYSILNFSVLRYTQYSMLNLVLCVKLSGFHGN